MSSIQTATNQNVEIRQEAPQSPNAMANAAVEQAMVRMSQVIAEPPKNNKRPKIHDKFAADELNEIWEKSDKNDEAYNKTRELVVDQIELLMADGLKAFHGFERASKDLAFAKEEVDSKDRELQRLRKSEEESKLIISVRCSNNKIQRSVSKYLVM